MILRPPGCDISYTRNASTETQIFVHFALLLAVSKIFAVFRLLIGHNLFQSFYITDKLEVSNFQTCLFKACLFEDSKLHDDDARRQELLS